MGMKMENIKNQYKVAVVTPYYRSDVEKLMRCCDSVAAQTIPCEHILVADGEAQAVFSKYAITHMVLPSNVGNSGATPRGFGGQYAFMQGYDLVAFLDADNWFEPEHLEKAIHALEQEQADLVLAKRNIVFPDGEVLQHDDPQDAAGTHVDTNCYVFSKKCAYLMAVWTMWPKEFGVGEDRVMLKVIRSKKLKAAKISDKTVWYESNWAIHYALAHKTPVVPLRKPSHSVHKDWDEKLFFSRTGISF